MTTQEVVVDLIGGGAALKYGIAFVQWAAKQFVREQIAPPLGLHEGDEQHSQSSDLKRSIELDISEMSIKQFRVLSTILKEEFNGRYMMAEEARGLFTAIERKLDRLRDEIRLSKEKP